MTLATEGVLQCRNSYSGGMGLLSEGTLYRLNGGITCQGDRSDVCCPYAAGTKVAVVGNVGASPHSSISDYWICRDGDSGEPSPPTWTAPSKPLLLDVQPWPPFVTGFGAPLAWAPLAFWFGDRVALWDPSTERVEAVGAPSGPPLSCLARGPDGARAVTIDVNGTGTLWDVATARAITSIPGLALPSFRRRIEPDASCTNFLARQIWWSEHGPEILVVTTSGRALLVDETRIRELEPSEANPGWFSSDGSAVFLQTDPHWDLHVWDLRTGQRIPQPTPSIDTQFPDGRLGLCGPSDDEGRSSSCSESRLRATEPPRALPFGCGMEASPTGRFLNVSTDCSFGDPTTSILRDSDFRVMARAKHTELTTWASRDDVLAIQSDRGVEIWSSKGPMWLAGKPGDRLERGFLWSPDAQAVATPLRVFGLSPKRRFSLGAQPFWAGAWTSDSKLLAVWNLTEDGPYYENKSSLRLRVIDASSGCILLDIAEQTSSPSIRQAQIGATQPRWIGGTDALELPVFGSDSVFRLVRPRTGEVLWLTMAERAGRLEPIALSTDGRYAGSESSVRDALSRVGSPKLTGSLRAAPELLHEFFARAANSIPACKPSVP